MEDEIIKTGTLDSELEYNFVRSSGPGGQNVNKVNSKVELRFDVLNSSILSARHKLIILEVLKTKISDEGVYVLTCQTSRSQLENKELVTLKFYTAINKALKPKKVRFTTKPTKASKEKRLQQKRENSEKKDRRREV
jgi:ribosome-associated protein